MIGMGKAISIILITIIAMEIVIMFAGDEVDEGEGEGEGGGRKEPLLPQIEIFEPTSHRYSICWWCHDDEDIDGRKKLLFENCF